MTTGAAEESGIGSSPLSRGILHHAARDVRVRRIIPALAGNTCSPRRKTHPPGDHPRSRGEYLEAYGLTVWQLGSSPLSRGIQLPSKSREVCRGIIPALAGNTSNASSPTSMRGDHPRSRGEYYATMSEVVMSDGSSPLSRGIRNGKMDGSGLGGIIPALAGNTYPYRSQYSPRRDHPRSRGEYVPPRNRTLRKVRIIPALAGNTPSPLRRRSGTTDHPRSRGEYGVCGGVTTPLGGSSPLSRGILAFTHSDAYTFRIIPALAGNTGRR